MTEARRRVPEWWLPLAAVVALPILLAAVRGVRRGYLPIGDNALIEIRARDVLTSHHPLLGTWSSASISSGVDVNHPGPLLFDVVAPTVRTLGAGPGVAFGVAALQIAVVTAIAWAAHRIGGRNAAVATLAVTAILVWSIGSELLYDPWQPNLLMLPFLLLLVLVWGVVAGRHGMLPWAVLVASFCVQSHLSYVFIAPALLLAAALVVARRVWWVDGSWQWSRAGARPLGLGLVVGLLAWSQPLVEQLFGSGQGNLSRLAFSGGGGDGVRTGLSLGIRLVASVVALPPWFTRSGMTTSVPGTSWTEGPDGRTLEVTGLVGLGGAVAALVVLAAVMAAIVLVARRRQDTVVLAAVAVFTVAMTVALVTVVITPIDDLGLSPHKIRWLWPLGAFGLVAVVAAAMRWAPRSPSSERRLQLAGVAVAMVSAAATVPFHAHDSGPVSLRDDIPRIRGLVAQLDVLRGRGPVLFDASGLYFAEPFTAPVMAGLQRAGVPFLLDEEGLVRQMGERRRDDGSARLRVFVREGREALVPTVGTERIAFQPALDTDEVAEWTALQSRLADWRRESGPGSESLPAEVPLDELGDLAAVGLVDLTGALGADTDRYVELDQRWRGLGVAVFAEPLP